MRPESRNDTRTKGWKKWLDRVAVAWIVCAPLLVLMAGGLGLLQGTSRTDPAPSEVAASDVAPEVPIQYRLPQGTETSALPAEGQSDEPWRTAAVRSRR